MDEKTMQAAMDIILHAGDSRLACMEALDAANESNFELADEKMKAAQKNITVAHKTQTEQIQDESRGEETKYSLLFTHAQDTLMTINSEINLSKHMIKMMKTLDARFKALEEK